MIPWHNAGQGQTLGSEQYPVKIVIPVYNEANRIGAVLTGVEKHICSRYPAEIMLMDDGSSDNTVEIAQTAQHQGLSLNIYQNWRNRGKGYTLRRAMQQLPSNAIAVFMDGDGEHCPEDIPCLLEPIINKEADIVIGSRFLTAGQNLRRKVGILELLNGSYLNNQKKLGQIRKLGNISFTLLIFLLYREFITDSQSGFRAFRPGAFRNIHVQSRGFQVETEMTVKAIRQGLRIVEVPIRSGKASRGSYMKLVKDSLKIICVIVEQVLPTCWQPGFQAAYKRILR